MSKSLFSVKETAEQIGIGRNRLYSLIKERKIKTVKVGPFFRINQDSINEFMERLSEAGSVDDLPTLD